MPADTIERHCRPVCEAAGAPFRTFGSEHLYRIDKKLILRGFRLQEAVLYVKEMQNIPVKISLDRQKHPSYTFTDRKQCLIISIGIPHPPGLIKR
jgi:hypothetical protein